MEPVNLGGQAMLVLSRKIGDKIVIGSQNVGDGIVIGQQIVVTVLGVRGRHVRLGLEAPEDVGIWREEVLLEDEAAIPNQPTRVRH
jgi:carbon storage regulator